ncbi:MAG: DUF805 domain-containing protein [Alphaproteobacteria bacterium]
MTFLEAIKTCLVKYNIILGRASRAEFWWFQLVYIPLAIILILVFGIFYSWIVLGIIAFLGILPFCSVMIRRLHDTNHSGYHLLFMLIVLFMISFFEPKSGAYYSRFFYLLESGEYIALLVMLIFFSYSLFILSWLITPGDKGKNKFGHSPQK